MNAVKFDWLTQVDGLEVYDGNIYFYLKHSNETISCYCEAKSKIEAIEVNVDSNPQNNVDRDHEVFFVEAETVCFVDDFDNVHAVRDMPFKLTGDQINTINDYLKDEAQPV